MTLDSSSINLLRDLSESFGPSGFEREPASIVKKAGAKLADEILYDKLGSIVFKACGKADSPKVLLAGHMDEVGFVVTGVEK